MNINFVKEYKEEEFFSIFEKCVLCNGLNHLSKDKNNLMSACHNVI